MLLTTILSQAFPVSERYRLPACPLMHEEESASVDSHDCLSPVGYSTGSRGIGCTPTPREPAQSHLQTRLVLNCTIRYLSRVTRLVSRGAPPCVLSPTSIPGVHRCLNRATSAHCFAAIPGSTEDWETKLAWGDRISFGELPWKAFLSRCYQRLAAPGRLSRPGASLSLDLLDLQIPPWVSASPSSGWHGRARTCTIPLNRRALYH